MRRHLPDEGTRKNVPGKRDIMWKSLELVQGTFISSETACRSVLLEHGREVIRRHAVRGRRNDSVDMSQAYAKCLVHVITSIPHHNPMQQLPQLCPFCRREC